MTDATSWLDPQTWLDTGRVPEIAIRTAVKALLVQRQRELHRPDIEARERLQRALLDRLSDGPVAVAADAANSQHYRVPPAFFETVLGPRLKYSCARYPTGDESLAQAEVAMLELTAKRAGIEDGQRVLDLGCGWGSLTCFLLERFPALHVTALSNSPEQRAFIEARAAALGAADRLEVITADIATFEAFPDARRFDRVVSVEMFEHVRNHRRLLERIASWLEPTGELFVHHFAHRELAYLYEDRDASDWMAREFFTGGMMPSADWLERVQGELRVVDSWIVDGTHYARTCEHWLQKHHQQRDRVLDLFGRADDPVGAVRQFARWQTFFVACAELFAWRGGTVWFVVHKRLARRH